MSNTKPSQKLNSKAQSLRFKTILIVGGSIVGFLATMYIFAVAILWRGFSQIEQRDADTNIERLHNRIDAELLTLNTKVRDWASWDDAWEYMISRSKQFENGNLDPNTTLINLNADLLLYINLKRELVAGLEWDPIAGKPVRMEQPLLDQLLSEKFHHIWSDWTNPNFEARGIVTIHGTSWLMAARPVTKTDHTGDIRGTFILGERLTSKRVEAMAQELQLDLKFQPHTSKNRKLPSKYKWNSINMGVPFQNFDATPAFSVRIQFSRDVMQQGRLTLISMLMLITIAGIGIAFLMLSLLDRRILSRIEALRKGAQDITNSGSTHKLLQDNGKDEIKDLTISVNAMVSALDRRNEEIREIVENVKFGFFLTNLKGQIQRGHTTSSTTLLNTKNLAGKDLSTVLNFTDEQRQLLELTLEQVEEDLMPDDVTLNQLPKRVQIQNRTISLEAALIRDRHQKPNRLLVSIADVSALDQAEQKNRDNHTILAILRGKQAFASLLDDMSIRQPLLEKLAESGNTHQLRQDLHTLNGNLRCFELWDLVQLVTHVENQAEISPLTIQTLFKNFEDWVTAHSSLTGVSWQRLSETTTWEVSEQFVDQIRQFDIKSASKDELRYFKDWLVQEIRTKPIQDLASTFENLALATAEKLGKSVALTFVGAHKRVNSDFFQIVADIIPHMLRNAIDHGIEPRETRINSGKEGIGKIMLAFEMTDNQCFRISISDDGAGIDIDRLTKRAIENQLIDKQVLDALNSNEKLRLILHPQLSSKSEVEEFSGRGYGMAAVRERIEDELGGKIAITSISGKGTTILIDIPIAQKETLGTDMKAAI